MRLADRMRRIQPSATLTISTKAKAMKAQGIDVVGFGAGEPDFDTPRHIKDAAIQATLDGFTKYTPVGGSEELKDAIRARVREDLGLEYRRSQVIVSCGAKHVVYNAVMALFQEGDEVLIPSPYWVSYPEILAMAGATPVILPTREEDGFKLRPEVLRRSITPRTKGLILNSPSNPTGAVYTQAEMEDLARIVLDAGFVVISDEIYDKLLYGGIEAGHMAAVSQEMMDRTLLVNGVSKTYAMTGWRIGFALGPEDLISAMDTVQGQSTSNPTSIAQKAAVAALRGPQDCVTEMVREFDRRRRFMVERLNRMKGVSCLEPLGAFYAFPNVSAHLGKKIGERQILTPSDLAAYLLEEARVAVVAGEPFGSDQHIRLSFALSIEEIEKGLDRIEEALEKLA
ncbi:MAG: pyridoxal phosphate-dependent aminotransferase [Thermodesulfobacteriota bacterium]